MSGGKSDKKWVVSERYSNSIETGQ